MKPFEAPTVTVKDAVLKDIITASNAGSDTGVPSVSLPPDPNF